MPLHHMRCIGMRGRAHKFLLMPVSIEDMEGVENFAALIIRKDNPRIIDIVTEFSNTVAMFRVKPDGRDM